MMLLDLSTASAGVAAIAIIKDRKGVRLVAAPELAALSQVELIGLMVDGAASLLAAVDGLQRPATASSP
jgi:hypothetical protein